MTVKVKEDSEALDQVDIKGGESHPDIVERIKQILNKE